MKRPRKRVSNWMRMVCFALLLSPDRETAARRLGITKFALQQETWHLFKLLDVTNEWRAAMKLGVVKIDYEKIPDWLSVDEVKIIPGMTCVIGRSDIEDVWDPIDPPTSLSLAEDSLSWHSEKHDGLQMPRWPRPPRTKRLVSLQSDPEQP